MKYGVHRVAWLLVLAATAGHASLWPGKNAAWDAGPSKVEARVESVRQLGHTNPREILPFLARALDDSDPRVWRAAAEVTVSLWVPLGCHVAKWLTSDDRERKLVSARVLEVVPCKEALPMLRALLNERDAELRVSAIRALDALDSTEATGVILSGLHDVNDRVRSMSLRSVMWRESPRINEELWRTLVDSDPVTRLEAAKVLWARGELRSVAAVSTLLNDRSAQVQWVAVRASDDLTPAERVPMLLSVLADVRASSVIEAASFALAKSLETLTVASVLEQWALLQSDSARQAVERGVRKSSAFSGLLSHACHRSDRVGVRARCAAFCVENGCDWASVMAQLRSNHIERSVALEALGRAAEPATLSWLLSQFDAEDPESRRPLLYAIERVLAKRPYGLAFPHLKRWFALTPPESNERARIVALFGKTGAPRAKDALLAIALDPSSSDALVFVAIQALEELGTAGLGVPLLGLLNHPNAEVATAAASALFGGAASLHPSQIVSLADRDAVRRKLRFVVLSSSLASTTDRDGFAIVLRQWEQLTASERDALLEGMARNTSDFMRRSVEELAYRGTSDERRKIAESLVGRGGAQTLLLRLAEDPDSSVRQNAVWSLGREGNQSAWPLLESRLRDASPEVRSNALVALGRIAAREARSIEAQACAALSFDSVALRLAALTALRLTKERCSSGDELRSLRNGDENIRMHAAWLISAVPRPFDIRALRACESFETSPRVRAFCRGNIEPVESAGKAKPTLYFIEQADPRFLREQSVPFALIRANGLLRFGTSDRRGAVFEPDADAAAHLIALVAPR